MEQTIFLPTGEDMSKLIRNALNAFCEQAKKAGYNLNDEMEGGLLQDGFVAGYCSGWNDMLGIIRDQLNVDKDVKNMLNNGDNESTMGGHHVR
jgi:hypothetical protein